MREKIPFPEFCGTCGSRFGIGIRNRERALPFPPRPTGSGRQPFPLFLFLQKGIEGGVG